jgi:hypothetical protein
LVSTIIPLYSVCIKTDSNLAFSIFLESEVVQAAELLEQWRKRSPIEVSDALKLLGMNVPFQTGLVSTFIPLHNSIFLYQNSFSNPAFF